jgi:hypothetical protein
MCSCASCHETDKLRVAGFAAWPRGNPAGPRASKADYAAHVRHGLAWGRRPNGNMHHAPEFPGGVQRTPLRYSPASQRDGGAHRSYPTLADAKLGTAHYVAQFLATNGYVTAAKAKEREDYRRMVEKEEKANAKRWAVRKPTPRLLALAQELRRAA